MWLCIPTTCGVPAYIELFDNSLNILQNLQQRIVTPANVMLSEAVFLLREQLDYPRNYVAVLESLAAGFHRLTDIATMAGIDRSNITKYLAVLRELGYVERLVPATVRHPEKSRQGRYVITDPYLRLYYRFLAPYRSAIAQGRVRQATSLLYDHLLDFIGMHTFEELCREWVNIKAEIGELPLLPERTGSFWSKQAQVDVLAINWRTKDILLGECKWVQASNGFGQGLLEAVDFNLHILRIAGNDFGQRGYQVAGGEAVQLGQTVIAEGVAIDAQGGGHFDSHPTQGIFLEDIFVGKEVDLPRLRLANAPGAAAGKVV